MKRTWLVVPTIVTILLLACGLFAPEQVIQEVEQPEEVIVLPENPAEVEPIPDEPGVPTEPPEVPDQTGIIAHTHLEALTAIGARPSGSKNELLAAEYISNVFSEAGYSPEILRFSAWDENDEAFSSQNVIAVKQGDSKKEIIIGAHYDSGDESLGADDNASGVAVMLETAESIAELDTPYTIRFIAFGSEENDLDGSVYYAARMEGRDVENTLAMINLDSLAAGDYTYVYSDEGEDAFLRDWVLEWASNNNLPLQTISNADLTDDGDYVADYGAFKERGIPFIYFEATNWTVGTMDGWTQVDPKYGDGGYIWHTPFDNLDYLDETFPGRVDEHLHIFVSALIAITTEFSE